MSLKHTGKDEKNKDNYTCLWWTETFRDIWVCTFGPSDDMDALSSGDSGLDICRAVGSWYLQVWKVKENAN